MFVYEIEAPPGASFCITIVKLVVACVYQIWALYVLPSAQFSVPCAECRRERQ